MTSLATTAQAHISSFIDRIKAMDVRQCFKSPAFYIGVGVASVFGLRACLRRFRRAQLHPEYLRGKIAIVTGSNTGIGEQTAKILASEGVQVIMACRSAQRGDAARARILQQIPGARVTVLQVDLSNLQSVKDFVAAFRALGLQKLDLLINNAGIAVDFAAEKARIEQGQTNTVPSIYEETFASNILGHALLVELLLPELQASGQAHVLNVGSLQHSMMQPTTEVLPVRSMVLIDELKKTDLYNKQSPLMAGMELYGYSTLCRIWHTKALHDQYHASTGIRFNVLHPGLVATEFTKNMPSWVQWLQKVLYFMAGRTPTQGAWTTVHAANVSDPACSGHYFDDSRIQDDHMSAESRKKDRQRELYDFLMEQLRSHLAAKSS